MRETIAVLGAGNMGSAVAQVLASNGHAVRAWSIETDVLEEMRGDARNTKYLAGVELHPRIEAVWELEKAVGGAAVVVLSVPSQIVAGIARDLKPFLRRQQFVLNVAKGLESGTNCRLSEVIVRELGEEFRPAVGSMGGPAIAEMGRICVALGGQAETVYGLAGLGDLLTTGYSQHSRNRTLGEMLGVGGDWQRFVEEKTVEGVPACGAVRELVGESGLALPLLETIDAIICKGAEATLAMGELFRAYRYD